MDPRDVEDDRASDTAGVGAGDFGGSTAGAPAEDRNCSERPPAPLRTGGCIFIVGSGVESATARSRGICARSASPSAHILCCWSCRYSCYGPITDPGRHTRMYPMASRAVNPYVRASHRQMRVPVRPSPALQ